MRASAWSLSLALACLAGCRANVVEPELAPAWSASDLHGPLSRADCIALALHSAPNAAAFQARLSAARAKLEQAGKLANPTLGLSFEDFGLNSAAAASSLQTTLSLAFALEDVFSRERRSAAAHHALEAEAAQLRAEAGRLAAEVEHAYDELALARAQVALHDELAEVARKQRDDVHEFVASGIAPRIDLERAESELAQAQADAARSQAGARAKELAFAFSLGFERPQALALSESWSSASTAAARDLEALLCAAANTRPEIAAANARYQEQLERLKLSAERVQFLPTVGAGPRVQGDELRGVATIDVALPLFDSGAAGQHLEEAALLAAAAQLRRAAQDVARDVCAALERLTAAETYLEQHARDLAERRRTLREHTERLFRAGEAEYALLAQSRRDEVEARIALLDAELAAAAARVDLDAALGTIATQYDNR